MCTIPVSVAQRSPSGCAGLFDLNINTVSHGSSYFYGDDMFLALLAPLLFSIPPLNLLYHLIFFPLLPSIFQALFYTQIQLLWVFSLNVSHHPSP